MRMLILVGLLNGAIGLGASCVAPQPAIPLYQEITDWNLTGTKHSPQGESVLLTLHQGQLVIRSPSGQVLYQNPPESTIIAIGKGRFTGAYKNELVVWLNRWDTTKDGTVDHDSIWRKSEYLPQFRDHIYFMEYSSTFAIPIWMSSAFEHPILKVSMIQGDRHANPSAGKPDRLLITEQKGDLTETSVYSFESWVLRKQNTPAD